MITKVFKIIYESIWDAVEHEGIEHAGYISFLLMLTIFPFLVFFVALVGFFGQDNLSNLLVNLILNSSWASFIDALRPRILEITSSPPQGLLTIAIISAIWTASSIFEAIRGVLNKAYRIDETKKYISRRLISFIEFGVLVLLTLTMLISATILPMLFGYINKLFFIEHSGLLEIFDSENRYLRFIILVVYGFTIIGAIYKYLPSKLNEKISVIPGTIGSIVGFAGATYVFKLYINYFPSINIIYGSIAGVIIALLYFYICSFIFIVGAELNYLVYKARKN